MLFQINNTFVVNDVNDVPLNKLKLLSQLMIIEERYIDEIEQSIDIPTHLILKEKTFGYIYLFSKIENDPHVYWDPDVNDEELEKIEESGDREKFVEHVINKDIDYRTNSSEECYLLLKNKLYQLKPRMNQGIVDYVSYLDEEGGYNYDVYRTIYKKLFIEGNNSSSYYSLKVHDTIYHYVTFQLDNDNSIIVNFSHNILLRDRSWNSNYEISIINRNNQMVKINCQVELIIELLQKENIFSHYLVPNYVKEKFNQYYKVFKYDIQNYIEDYGRGLFDVHEVFKYDLDYLDIEKFYRPIYENKELNFKAYLNTVRRYCGDIIYTVNDKIVSRWQLENKDEFKENYDKFSEQITIAKQFFNFIVKPYSINPMDGNFYIDGVIDNNHIGYKDDEGIICRYKGYNFHCYKLNGYFVQTDDPKIVEQIMDRERLMNKLRDSF